MGLVYLGAHRRTSPTGKTDMSGWLKYLFGCFILCLPLQGVDVFVMKSVKGQCLVASVRDSHVLMETCNPGSPLKEWMWKGTWLYNRGTKRCLSADGTFLVMTAVCENGTNLAWVCRDHNLVHVETSRFLTSDGPAVSITREKRKKSRWRSANNTNICEEKLRGKTHITSATISKPRETIGIEKQNMTRELNNTLAQQLPFPMEDPTNWNYAILALAFVVLFLALLILARNSRANRARKMKAWNGAAGRNETEADSTQKAMMQYVVEVDNLAETDQMLQSKQTDIALNQVAQTSSPKVVPKDGQILVEWKDGNIDFLYTDSKDDDV